MTAYMQRIIKGFSVTFVITLLAAALAYLYRVYLSRTLTLEEFGLFYAVFAFIAFFMNFVDLGSSNTLVKFIPEYLVQNKLDQTKATIYFIAMVMFTTSIIFFALFWIFSDVLSIHYFKNSNASLVIILMALSFVFSTGHFFLRQLVLGFQRIVLYSTLDLAKVAAIFLLTVLFFLFFNNIFAPVLAYVFAYLLVVIIYIVIFLKSVFPGFFKQPYILTKPLTRRIILFSLPATFAMAGGIFFNYIDTIVLTYMGTLKDVAIYNVAFPTAALLGYLGTSIRHVFFPAASELWVTNQKEKLTQGIELFNKYLPLTIVPASLFILHFSPLIVTILFKQKFISATGPLNILLIGNIFLTIAFMYRMIFLAVDKPKIDAGIAIFAGLMNLFLNVLLIPKYSIIGAAVATSFTYFMMLVISFFFIRKYITFHNPIILWIKTALLGAAFYITLKLCEKIFAFNIYLNVVGSSIVSFTLYVGLVFLFKIVTVEEIKKLATLIIQKKGGKLTA